MYFLAASERGQSMGVSGAHMRRAAAVFIAGVMLLVKPLNAADLQTQTAQNYKRYITLTWMRVDCELADGDPYLWVERLQEPRRIAVLTALRNGEIVIEHLETLDAGKQIPTPGGMIHHWIGTVFVPGATLAKTLAFMQDYDHNSEYFRANILRSTILKHEGDDYFVQQRFYKKKIITTVIDTDQQVHYHVVNKTQAWSRSDDTRVQEVVNAGRPDERLEPEGHDRGFVWKLSTFWRFEEKDGGTYMECQAISLSRDIPMGLGWMVGSLVSSLSKESLTFTLTTTRTALAQKTVAWNYALLPVRARSASVEGQVISKGAKSQAQLIRGIHVVLARDCIENLLEEVKKGMREKAGQEIYPSGPPLG
jgi:hypothetical protein